MKDKLSVSEEVQKIDMQNYYKFQAKIYDATRWIFLFGRNAILKKIPLDREASLQILEVGCGTGVNLRKMVHLFPNATLTGLDVSADMLAKAKQRLQPYQNRVTLLHEAYQKGETKFAGKFDVILFSYCLSMVNPHFNQLIEQTLIDLKPDGYIAVVDFHDTPSRVYKKFMRSNHVRLDGHLLPILYQYFSPTYSRVRKGWFGIWEYMLFVGQKKGN
ncbi:MAG: class I SAM-dependent methyltransferase [Microscillaceae bacterium]|nr:class I SAM-dependent methyltransferase [Microscillaceae bacterium]MDW8460269.1 class I SAM-dependent methyltransferase [Cytophagales bacterium]